jgi:acetoacetate decarboxylase
LLDPARYQYREFCALVAARWKEMPVFWVPYMYCDNDSAIGRGWIQGFPRRLGQVFQTRTFAAPGPASAPIAPGTKFGVSLSVHGQRLANGRLTLRYEQPDATFALDRPTVGRRYLPNLAASKREAPAIDELVLAVTDDFTVIDVWCGEAELTFPEALGEELHLLAPVRIGTGFRFSISRTINDLKVLEESL